MKTSLVFAVVAAVALSGCAVLEKVAPNTVEGWRNGGVLGAIDAGTGAVVGRCINAQGTEFRVAVSVVADEIGVVDSLETVREKIDKACAVASAVRVASELVNE